MGVARKGSSKQTFTTDVGIPQFYKYYINKQFKTPLSKGDPYYLSVKEYNEILSRINSAIRDIILKDNSEINLPRIGKLSVKKTKKKLFYNSEGKVVNSNPVDWKATWEMWEKTGVQKKTVKLDNDHTNGWVFKWILDISKSHFKQKYTYKFYACRTAKLLLRDRILEGDFNGYEIVRRKYIP